MTIASTYLAVDEAVRNAAVASGRTPDAVTLLAISKGQSIAKMQAVYDCGQRAFGENYLQEALEKQAALTWTDVTWHYVGRVQTNKTREIAAHFDWVHALDQIKQAERLSAARASHLPPLNVCVAVNIDHNPKKTGVSESDVLAFAKTIATMPRLHLRGVMVLPEPRDTVEAQRVIFCRVKTMVDDLNAAGLSLDTLSMGMSSDFPEAILAGSTMVRIGTALFGARAT